MAILTMAILVRCAPSWSTCCPSPSSSICSSPTCSSRSCTQASTTSPSPELDPDPNPSYYPTPIPTPALALASSNPNPDHRAGQHDITSLEAWENWFHEILVAPSPNASQAAWTDYWSSVTGVNSSASYTLGHLDQMLLDGRENASRITVRLPLWVVEP